ncbi:hypothetical protein H310_03085 [Aphanomyces invadans]|uniref:Uncharacterized protein n=1 Tax=Aphanomyces invadans TaxID=157072 RepID=A0A024ULD8_9STRA|nr:hypothetical protein H310_03085 [Aphanomyces invadans]ETW06985.1 hypothetical protein H310_03085 [Aphanomyces invadans]|eukprot:XP_008865060.1 hypothetical protein H310_03085 [Aphanomyces invadans]
MSLQPLQSPLKPSALSTFAATTVSPTSTPLGSVRPTALNVLQAPMHELASLCPLKPQPSALASFAATSPLKQPTPASALSSFAAKAATPAHSPTHLSPVAPSALSPLASSEALAPLKRPSALASFAAQDVALVSSTRPTNHVQNPRGASGGRPLASLGLHTSSQPDEKARSRDDGDAGDDKEKESISPTFAEAKDIKSTRPQEPRLHHEDESPDEKSTGDENSDKEDLPSDEIESAASDSDDAKESKLRWKAYSCKKGDGHPLDQKSSMRGGTTRTCPPPLSFPIQQTNGDRILLAMVNEDVDELKRLLDTSSMGSLGAIRDSFDRSVMHYAVGIGAESMCQLVLGFPQASFSNPSSPRQQSKSKGSDGKLQSERR